MADIVINPADVQYVSGTYELGFLGEAVTAGAVLTYDSTTRKWILGENDVTEDTRIGIALASGAADQLIGVLTGREAVVYMGAGLMLQGELLVISGTGGGVLMPASDFGPPESMALVGYCPDDDSLALIPKATGIAAP